MSVLVAPSNGDIAQPMSQNLIRTLQEDGVTMETYATLINHFAKSSDIPDHKDKMVHWFEEMRKIGTPLQTTYDDVIGAFAVDKVRR